MFKSIFKKKQENQTPLLGNQSPLSDTANSSITNKLPLNVTQLAETKRSNNNNSSAVKTINAFSNDAKILADHSLLKFEYNGENYAFGNFASLDNKKKGFSVLSISDVPDKQTLYEAIDEVGKKYTKTLVEIFNKEDETNQDIEKITWNEGIPFPGTDKYYDKDSLTQADLKQFVESYKQKIEEFITAINGINDFTGNAAIVHKFLLDKIDDTTKYKLYNAYFQKHASKHFSIHITKNGESDLIEANPFGLPEEEDYRCQKAINLIGQELFGVNTQLTGGWIFGDDSDFQYMKQSDYFSILDSKCPDSGFLFLCEAPILIKESEHYRRIIIVTKSNDGGEDTQSDTEYAVYSKEGKLPEKIEATKNTKNSVSISMNGANIVLMHAPGKDYSIDKFTKFVNEHGKSIDIICGDSNLTGSKIKGDKNTSHVPDIDGFQKTVPDFKISKTRVGGNLLLNNQVDKGGDASSEVDGMFVLLKSQPSQPNLVGGKKYRKTKKRMKKTNKRKSKKRNQKNKLNRRKNSLKKNNKQQTQRKNKRNQTKKNN